ncbi:MAG: Ig-like domain-containing protein [Gemmatimonadetes bacterium]|nr:Ig-like domain-containing protein [Gemmatimonadota bacterium]
MIRPYSRAFVMITASIYFMILAGCGGGDSSPTSPTPSTPTPPAPPPTPVATSLTVTPSSHTLATIGATVQLSATVRDQNNNPMSGQTVTWTSSNTGVATVSGNGLVTAVSNGTTQITARSGNASGTSNITVAEPVPTRIAVTPSSHTLEEIGETVQLRATVRDQRNNAMSGQTITWSSGDEAVATVDGNGLVTAVSDGMAEITAKSGNLSANATITVASPVPTTVTIEPAAHTFEAIGDTLQLAAVVLDQRENAMMDVTVTWSSGDEAVATVDENGLVTAVDNGMAEITAEAGDAMGTAAITVSQVPANISIEVDAEATTLTEIGQTLQLMVSVSDANEEPISEPSVTWMSSDEAVVTVDEDGLVEAVGNGMADVMAASGDVSDMVSITVMDPDAVEEGDDEEEVPDEEVDEIVYEPWVGVKVYRGRLEFTVPGLGTLPLTGCSPTLNGFSFGGTTITVHYSIWQRRDDMNSPWEDIEDTRETFKACAYDSDIPGEYRLVGEVTLDGVTSLRASENTFVVP